MGKLSKQHMKKAIQRHEDQVAGMGIMDSGNLVAGISVGLAGLAVMGVGALLERRAEQ